MSVDIHDLKTVRLVLSRTGVWPTRRRPAADPPRRRGRAAGPGAWSASQLVNAGVYVGTARHARQVTP